MRRLPSPKGRSSSSSSSDSRRSDSALAEALRSAAREHVPGPHIYDVTRPTSTTIAAVPSTERDLEACWETSRETSRNQLLQRRCWCAGAERCARSFRSTRDLINFKKVSYHLHRQASALERSLTQVATFFWDDNEECLELTADGARDVKQKDRSPPNVPESSSSSHTPTPTSSSSSSGSSSSSSSVGSVEVEKVDDDRLVWMHSSA